MIDLRLTQDINGQFDLTIKDGNLDTVEGFDTALQVSLFTDARASSSQVVRSENRRGWIGNLVNIIPDRQLGGLIWLIEQRRLIQDTLNEVVNFAKKSLDWLIEDGLAITVEVLGEIIPLRGIQLTIKITAKDGVTETRFFRLWEVTGT